MTARLGLQTWRLSTPASQSSPPSKGKRKSSRCHCTDFHFLAASLTEILTPARCSQNQNPLIRTSIRASSLPPHTKSHHLSSPHTVCSLGDGTEEWSTAHGVGAVKWHAAWSGQQEREDIAICIVHFTLPCLPSSWLADQFTKDDLFVVCFVCLFGIGFLYIVLVVLELTLYIRLASTSQRSACICLLSVGFEGMDHQSQLWFLF